MANILPENETFTFEDREYVNPQVSLDEQNAFIDNLRQTQQQNTGEIVQQTRNLGTEVPSNLGGLVGGEGYWTSRYQTPQTNAVVSQLRSTAQAQALNDILANEQAMWKKRYQDAYRAYQKKSGSGGGGTGGDGNNGNSSGWDGDPLKKATDEDGSGNGGGTDGNETTTPPNPDDYWIDGEEQTQRIKESTGLPEDLINVIKILG